MNVRRKLYLVATIGLFCVNPLFGQIESQRTLTGNKLDQREAPMIASPMSESFGTFSGVRDDVRLETRNVNIAPAVAAYAKLKKVELQQARYDALQYLDGIRDQAQQNLRIPKPQFKPLSADRYEVTATRAYFDNLPAMIRSFELGKRSIVVTIEYLNLDDVVQQEMRKFLLGDTVEHLSGGVANVSTELPKTTEEGSLYRASSSLQISKSMPVTVGQLDHNNYNRLMKLVRSRKSCEVISSPTVVTHPGQAAVVQDGALRPFVVGVKPIDDEFVHANQPVIQALEDGNFFKARCNLVDENVQMECSFAFAEVSANNTLTLNSFDDGSEITVQTPSHHVRSVTLGAELAKDRVLMIDPYHTKLSEADLGGRKRLQKHNVIALIRAKVISDE